MVNRRSPRLGEPESLPSASTPTELMRLNRCAVSRLSKPRSLACLNRVEMMVAMTTSASTAHTVEKATTRNARYRKGFLRIGRTDASTGRPFSRDGRGRFSLRRPPHAVAEPANRFDQVDAHFLAQPADEHLDGVRVAVEILVVKVL